MVRILAPLAAVVLAVGFALLTQRQDLSEEPEEYARLNVQTSDPGGAVEHLAKALAIATIASPHAPKHVANPAPFQHFHQFLDTSYPLIGQKLKAERVNDYSILYTWQGADPLLKPLLLLAHIDVVPAPTEGSGYNWTYPPFSGTVADGYIWGRGAVDNKGNLISIMEAITELLRQDFRPRRTIYLAFGHDEEVGGSQGALHIAKLLQSRSVEAELLVDEGGLVVSDGIKAGGMTLVGSSVALIGTAEKEPTAEVVPALQKFQTWELVVRGTGGHSSMPPSGSGSVAARLSRVLGALEANPPPARLISPMTEWVKTLGGAMKLAPLRLLFQNSDNMVLRPLLAQLLTQGGDDMAAMVRTTVAVVGVQAGGIADNVLPTSASIKLNFRTLPGDNATYVRQYLQAVTYKEREHVEITQLYPEDEDEAVADVSPSDGPHYQLVRQAILETLVPQEGRSMLVAPYMLTGLTDSRYYGSVVPIAPGRVFRFSPASFSRGGGDLKRIHGVDERISVDDYLQGIGFFMRLTQLAASDASDEERAGGDAAAAA